MKYIKERIEKHRNAVKAQQVAQKCAEFEVVERAGQIWLTHNGVAFMQIPADSSAERIAELLHTARSAALTFEKL